MKKLIIVLFVFCGITNSNAQQVNSEKVAKLFGNNKGTIVIADNGTGYNFCYNKSRSGKRFLPASTFKIPNSLIGLESGIVTDENFVIKWDGVKREIADWNKDLTLEQAIKVSSVPYYQEMARRIGYKEYKNFFKLFSYGNNNLGSQIDMFWLDNSLKITAEEQLRFIKEFYNYQLPFSKRTIDIVKKILSEEKYGASVMKFKTGMGENEDGSKIGWLVGYVEKKNNVYFFAFNIEAKEYGIVKELRNTISRKVLKELKILE